MNRREIQQHIFDTLGTILVDKDPIKEDALLTGLALDTADFGTFFSTLQADFGIVVPSDIKSEISQLTDKSPYQQLTLEGLVDLILVHMKSGKAHRGENPSS